MSGQINTSTLLDNTVLSVELKNTKKNNALSLKMLDQMLVLFNQKNLTKKFEFIYKVSSTDAFTYLISFSLFITRIGSIKLFKISLNIQI